jgi:hypothetical protein
MRAVDILDDSEVLHHESSDEEELDPALVQEEVLKEDKASVE